MGTVKAGGMWVQRSRGQFRLLRTLSFVKGPLPAFLPTSLSLQLAKTRCRYCVVPNVVDAYRVRYYPVTL